MHLHRVPTSVAPTTDTRLRGRAAPVPISDALQRLRATGAHRVPDRVAVVVLCIAAMTLMGSPGAMAQSLTLSPQVTYVAPNAQAEITITLSEPVQAGGAIVLLALSPGFSGTVPNQVYLPQGESSGTFLFQAFDVEGVETIQAFETYYGSDDAEVHVTNTVGVGQTPNEHTGTLRLLPARPNPFSNRTVLGFELAARARVELYVYDPSGRLVRRLEDAILPAGRHSVAWDGRDETGSMVTPGVYLYRIVAGGVGRMAKLAFVR